MKRYRFELDADMDPTLAAQLLESIPRTVKARGGRVHSITAKPFSKGPRHVSAVLPNRKEAT